MADKNTTNAYNEGSIVRRLVAVSVAGNAILTVFKLIAGILGHSGAMVSDAVHSMSDVFTTIIAAIGVKLSQKASDKKHPYGHERLESIASLFLGIVLGITGVLIGKSGVENIVSGKYETMPVPTLISLIAAIVSILAKEAMYHYTKFYAKKINSSAFLADAWHHRSDALSSIGSLIGIGGAMLGLPIMDSIASVVICLFILKVTFDIIKEAVKRLLDTSCDDEYEGRIRNLVLSHPRVLGVDSLHTRIFGNRVYVDLEISVDGDLNLRDAHSIAEEVHSDVERDFPDVKHIMVHVNPNN